jgi:hypothetical protein
MSTVTTIRPNGTPSINATTLGGGAASAHGALSDNSDTTFIVANAVGNFAYLDLNNTVSLLSNERVENVRYRVRNRSATIGKYSDFLVCFVGPTGTESSREQVWANESSIGTDTLGYQESPPDGGRWQQVDIDGLTIRVGGVTHNSSEYSYPNLYELYADIQVDTQPYLTSLTWSNTDSTRPTIGWTFNDDDGDDQEQYLVKVYTAAQYTAPGFDPEVSAAFWSSGTTSSSSKSRQVGTDLIAGTTYRAYVKAARDFMGLGYWFSPWVSSADLTVAADVPDSPALTATADSALNRVAISVQGRVNMLPSQAANIDTGPSGWANNTNATVASTTTAGEFVKGGRALTNTAIAAAAMSSRLTARIPVTAGQTYIAHAQNRTRVTSRSSRVSLAFYNVASGGTALSTQTGTATANSTSFAQRSSGSAVAPVGATYADILLETTGTPAIGEVHIWDTISLAPGTSTFWGGGGFLSTSTVTLQASDDGGTTWFDVRTLVDLPDDSETVAFYDYSAPRGTARQYRAYVTSATLTGSTITSGASSTQSATIPLPTASGFWWLKNLYDPSMNTEVLQTDEMEFAKEEQSGTFRVLGRRYPVVVSQGTGGWDSSLTLLARGQAEWDKLDTLTDQTVPLLLQAPDGEQWHIRVLARSHRRMASPAGSILRGISLGYVEVDAPILET